MQNNISHLIISSTQMRRQVLRHLSKTLKNVELKTLYVSGSVAKVCLNVSKCSLYKQFRDTGVPKLSPGYRPGYAP